MLVYLLLLIFLLPPQKTDMRHPNSEYLVAHLRDRVLYESYLYKKKISWYNFFTRTGGGAEGMFLRKACPWTKKICWKLKYCM
jgi:hypothetical protein